MLPILVRFPEPYSPPMDKTSVKLREIDAEISLIRADMAEMQKRIGALQWEQIHIKVKEPKA